MTTRNPIAIVASQLPGRRALTILATALLAASFVSAGCNDNNTNKNRGRRASNSSSTTIKCGNATCNTATQKCENGACVPKNGATTIPCGSTTCNTATQKCENGACVPKDGATTIPCGSTTCDATTQKCESDACVLKPGFTQCGQSVCNDSTHSCDNSQCVPKSIACGPLACDAATQECKGNKCVIKGSTAAGCDPAYQKEVSGICATNNEGDGTCSSSPCTGDTVCQGGQCVSICSICTGSPKYAGCFSGQFPCEYDETSKKYMAVNNAYNPPQKMECASPICGLKTRPNSSGQSPCYSPVKGECARRLECVQLGSGTGSQYRCTAVPKPKLESPCGQACGAGKVCNPTTKQCETNSSAAHGECAAPPNVTRLSFTPDATPGESYRSTATFNTTIGRHSATVGGFEAAMNSCGDAQTSNTDYQVFLIHLDTYSNISVYSNTTSDEPFNKFSLALLNATKCSSYLVCEKDFRISKGRSLEQGSAKTLPAGDYYLIVKNNDVSNTAAQGKSWNLRVVKDTYTTEGECTGPEQSGATYTCDSDRKAYTSGCQTHIITPPSFAPDKITCLTTTDDSPTTTQGCYQESSSTPSCYGVTCNKPIVVDGSTKRTITFADLKKGEYGGSANYANPSFTNNSCTPTPRQPTGLQFTYVLKVTNLSSDSKVTVSLPATGEVFGYEEGSPRLASAEAVVRFQSTCGLGNTCLSAQSFSDDDSSKLPDKVEFSYPPKSSSATTPQTLYITVSLKRPSSFSYKANSGFNLTIGSK